MALTLLEAAKLNSGDVKRSAIIEMFAQNSDVLNAMPFQSILGDSYSYNVEGQLPAVAFRGFNESYTESTGIFNPQTERLRIAGGDLDVDKALIKTRGGDIRTTHESLKVKALALAITDRVINGDGDTNFGREFDGLRKRIVGNQLVPANLQAPSANSPLSLEALDDAITRVDFATHLIMSERMKVKLSSAARSSVGGDITWELNDFGKQVAIYNGLPILTADHNEAGARIIDFNEVGPGGGSTSQSMYIVSFDDGMVTGLQNGDIEVTDLGEIDSAPVLRTRVEWIVGMAVQHGRAAARIWGITDAAVTV